mmetsp:Transcript_36107/g.80345  ORF Transcript_36107/g.80345 Transcript_36107/m.80345 type:complete len:81 (+) Transcript_36107:217-459(+)
MRTAHVLQNPQQPEMVASLQQQHTWRLQHQRYQGPAWRGGHPQALLREHWHWPKGHRMPRQPGTYQGGPQGSALHHKDPM